MPEPAAEAIVADGDILRAVERIACVPFVDITSFTRLSEALAPVLHSHFESGTSFVAKHCGVILSLNCDAVLVACTVPFNSARFASDVLFCSRPLVASDKTTDFAGEHQSIRICIATADSIRGSTPQTYAGLQRHRDLRQRLEAPN